MRRVDAAPIAASPRDAANGARAGAPERSPDPARAGAAFSATLSAKEEFMDIQETLGRALSAVFAPFTFISSLARGDRIFHPDGVVYRAEVKALAHDGPLGELAKKLAGTAIVRLSGGLWPWPQGERRPDVLGVSARFRAHDEVTPNKQPGDQDLLFVTSKSLVGLMVAPLRTRVGDYLDNDYYAILPFMLADVGEVYLRMVPEMRSPSGEDRNDRLARAVERGTAVLRMDLQIGSRKNPWIPLAALTLTERMKFDEDALAFDPSSAAMGLVPYGALQRSRPAAYEASEAGRKIGRKLGRKLRR